MFISWKIVGDGTGGSNNLSTLAHVKYSSLGWNSSTAKKYHFSTKK
jgi:hypothetical protein